MGGKLQGLLGALSGAVSSACASGSSEAQVLAPLSRYTTVVHHILKLLGEATPVSAAAKAGLHAALVTAFPSVFACAQLKSLSECSFALLSSCSC